MIDTQASKSLAQDTGEALLFVHFEIRGIQTPAYGLLPVVLRRMLRQQSRLAFVQVSAFSSHLRAMVALFLSPSTTEKSAIEVMQRLMTSIATACRPCRIEVIQGVLVPDLPTLQEFVSSHQN